MKIMLIIECFYPSSRGRLHERRLAIKLRPETKSEIQSKHTEHMESTRLRVMRKEAAVARFEADLAEQGVRIRYKETEVALAEDKRLKDETFAVEADAVRRADEAARALLAEEEAEAAARKAAKVAEDEARSLAARNKALALENKQRVAAEKRALAEQQAREAAEVKRLARAARKTGTSAASCPAAPALPIAPAAQAPAPSESQETSRFSKIFAAVEQRRQLAFCAGYGLFMSRFGLVPTDSERGQVLVVGETDDSGKLVACSEEDLCRECFEKRATHMCMCRDCNARKLAF